MDQEGNLPTMEAKKRYREWSYLYNNVDMFSKHVLH